MHKTDLIKEIANQTGLSQKDAGADGDIFHAVLNHVHSPVFCATHD